MAGSREPLAERVRIPCDSITAGWLPQRLGARLVQCISTSAYLLIARGPWQNAAGILWVRGEAGPCASGAGRRVGGPPTPGPPGVLGRACPEPRGTAGQRLTGGHLLAVSNVAEDNLNMIFLKYIFKQN